MEKLGLARKGTLDWFKANGVITSKHENEVLGEIPREKDCTKPEAA